MDLALVRRFLAGEIPASQLPEPEFGPNGQTVYTRTYSRPLFTSDGERQPWTMGDTEGRTQEVWAETCRRVVLGNTSLDTESLDENEVESLFVAMFTMLIIPGGRHLWVDGTGLPYSRNCFAAPIGKRTSGHFRFLGSRLFEGGGVGANYSNDLLAETTPVQSRLKVLITCSEYHADILDIMASANGNWVSSADAIDVLSGAIDSNERVRYVNVPDTREGWVEQWGSLVDTACAPDNDTTFIFNVTDVRPFGSELKSYGGTASGPAPLITSLVRFEEILNGAQGRHLTSLEAMDLDHEIAASVVAGGARRSARLATKHWSDHDILDFIECKLDLSKHWSTNISVEIDDFFKEALDEGNVHAHRVLRALATGMIANGEPGVLNSSRMSEGERKVIRTTNPCVTGDTWVNTEAGLRQVNDLLGSKVSISLNGELHDSTEEGFFFTGHKPIIGLNVDGTVLKLTRDHKVMTPDGWVEAGNLAVGDDVTLNEDSEAKLENRVGRIIAITDEGTDDVYDVQVPGVNAFVANGIVVHNCGEIPLETEGSEYGEACNIGSVNLDKVARNTELGVEAFSLLGRFLYRSTLHPYPAEEASRIEAQNRRIGDGFMGLQEWVLHHDVRITDAPQNEELTQALNKFRISVRESADNLADKLGLPRPIKVTAIAPTGSIGKIPGVSPGIHPVLAKYAEQRIRFGINDPKLDEMRAKGYDIEPDISARNTMVVTIPTRDFIMDKGFDENLIQQADEVSVSEFLDLQQWVSDNFCGGTDGNAVSATASIPADTSVEDLMSVLYEKMFSLKGTTVFPDKSRPQQPVTAITKAEYEDMVEYCESVSASLMDDCATGACPIR